PVAEKLMRDFAEQLQSTLAGEQTVDQALAAVQAAWTAAMTEGRDGAPSPRVGTDRHPETACAPGERTRRAAVPVPLPDARADARPDGAAHRDGHLVLAPRLGGDDPGERVH